MKNTGDRFTNIHFNIENLDIYYVRNSILNSIKGNLETFSGCLLDIGCGKMPYKEFILNNSSVEQYVGLDIEGAIDYDTAIKPDYSWNGITMPFENNFFDSAIGTEVLEHCPEPVNILKETYRVLKPGSTFFFTVPFLWPLHEVPHDEYRYTPFSLERLLLEAGFCDIQIKATGGWHASMAQMLGLWVRRAPLGVRTRGLLSPLFKPIIKYLIKKDKYFAMDFNESQMITGLYGVAHKK
ncbi:MAG: SAM-dependent methyltransferase [Sphingobacteriales bacterium]|nr:MAG: SAM-dependent methyltransferase [Sphingobacteriales bacterium]